MNDLTDEVHQLVLARVLTAFHHPSLITLTPSLPVKRKSTRSMSLADAILCPCSLDGCVSLVMSEQIPETQSASSGSEGCAMNRTKGLKYCYA